MNVAQKVVVVTGAAQGLGKAIASKLALHGATLFICDVHDEQGKAVASSLQQQGLKARFVHLDVTCEQQWKDLYAKVVEFEEHIDVLINNAGITVRTSHLVVSFNNYF